MGAKHKTPEVIASVWNNPPNCPAPVFPLLYMECFNAEECRGFLQLEYLIGDIDFVGYRLGVEDILIDTLGRVFNLTFDGFVFPNFVIATLSENELKQNISTTLKCLGNAEFEREILNEKTVAEIIIKMATRFEW